MKTNYLKIAIFLISIGVICVNFTNEIFSDITNAENELIYTTPYCDKYQYLFKIFAEGKTIGPYKQTLESHIHSKIMDKEGLQKQTHGYNSSHTCK